MSVQRVTKQDVLPTVGPKTSIRGFDDNCPSPVFAFVGKALVKQADGTVTEQLSWIVPAEKMGYLVQCPKCPLSKHHSTSACRSCGAKLDNNIIQQQPSRPVQQAELEIQAQNSTNVPQQMHLTIPIGFAVLAVMLSTVCSVVFSPVPVYIVLGLALLWKLSLLSNDSRNLQPQSEQAESRLDGCREPAGPSRRIRIADLLSEEEPSPTRRIRIEDLLSKDEPSASRSG